MKKLIVHLVSDSSGQTVKHAARTALAQFTEIDSKEYNWPLIRNKELLDEVLSKIEEKPGLVLYTISNYEIRDKLKKFCYELKIPCISVVGKIIKEISAFLGIGVGDNITLGHRFDESYFDKMDAIDYTLNHDDGKITTELDKADIILIGPSRTSKTPTAVYLAYNGFKTANIPFIYGHPLPTSIEKINFPLIVGFIINPTRLIEIRETRMNLLQLSEPTNYTDYNIVQEECLQMRRICQQMKWPLIDVSRRSIEETAALVMKYYYDHRKENAKKILK